MKEQHILISQGNSKLGKQFSSPYEGTTYINFPRKFKIRKTI